MEGASQNEGLSLSDLVPDLLRLIGFDFLGVATRYGLSLTSKKFYVFFRYPKPASIDFYHDYYVDCLRSGHVELILTARRRALQGPF